MKKRVLHILGSGFTYGAILGVFLFIANTPAEASFLEVLKILLVAAVCAAVAGLGFSLLLFLYEQFRSRRFDPFRKELSAKGSLVLEDPAKRIFNGKQVSGWLFLTESELYFKSSAMDGVADCVLSVDEISSVEITDPRRCYVTVTMTSLAAETFAVTDPLPWFHSLGDHSK